jgi:hypothetical protein
VSEHYDPAVIAAQMLEGVDIDRPLAYLRIVIARNPLALPVRSILALAEPFESPALLVESA